jgi:hypothetical protein
MVSKYKMDSMDVTYLVSGKDMVDEELRDFTHIPCSDSIREKLKGYYFYSMINLFMYVLMLCFMLTFVAVVSETGSIRWTLCLLASALIGLVGVYLEIKYFTYILKLNNSSFDIQMRRFNIIKTITSHNKTIEDNDIVLAVSDLETDELDDEVFVPMYYTKEDSNLYIVPFVKYIFAVRINRGIDFDRELYKSMYNSGKDLMWDEYGEE